MGPYARRVLPRERATVDLEQERVSVTFRNNMAFIDQLDLENVDEKRLLNIESNARIGYDVPEDINRLLTRIVKIRRVISSDRVFYLPIELEFLTGEELIKDKILSCLKV